MLLGRGQGIQQEFTTLCYNLSKARQGSFTEVIHSYIRNVCIFIFLIYIVDQLFYQSVSIENVFTSANIHKIYSCFFLLLTVLKIVLRTQ